MPHAPIIMTTAKLPRKSAIIMPYLNSRRYSVGTVALVLSPPVNPADSAASSAFAGCSCRRTRQLMKMIKVTRNTPTSGKMMRTAFTGSSTCILQHAQQWRSINHCKNLYHISHFKAVKYYDMSVGRLMSNRWQKSSLVTTGHSAKMLHTVTSVADNFIR